MNNPFEIENVENNTLIKIDEFEEQIKLIDKLTKEYNAIKKEIKEQMIEAGKKINVEQVKWTTPKGIKITCSIGKPAEFEIVKESVFSEAMLADKYPDIWKECHIKKEVSKTIKNASTDRLVITLPKGEE